MTLEPVRQTLPKGFTPREQAERITKGIDKPHHIGIYTPEQLKQELFSLLNTKPLWRDKEWYERYSRIETELKKLPAHQARDIINQAQRMVRK